MIEKVKEFLKQEGFYERIQEFKESTANVELAAEALGVDGARIAKSMGLYSLDGVIIVVLAGDMKIDNHKFKETFGVKAKMISFDDTESLLGHRPGGVCPFALKENVKVYLDVSLKRFSMVYPACGSSNSAIGLTIPELEKLSGFISWVDCGKEKTNA